MLPVEQFSSGVNQYTFRAEIFTFAFVFCILVLWFATMYFRDVCSFFITTVLLGKYVHSYGFVLNYGGSSQTTGFVLNYRIRLKLQGSSQSAGFVSNYRVCLKLQGSSWTAGFISNFILHEANPNIIFSCPLQLQLVSGTAFVSCLSYTLPPCVNSLCAAQKPTKH